MLLITLLIQQKLSITSKNKQFTKNPSNFNHMLPRANKYIKPSLFVETKTKDQSLSRERLQINKSAHLHQKKKLNANLFSYNSVEKKKPSLLINNTPFKRHSRFFTQENDTTLKLKKQATLQSQQPVSMTRINNSSTQISNLKRSPQNRQQVIRQIYQRESSLIRKSSQKITSRLQKKVQPQSQSHPTNPMPSQFLTSQQVLKSKHNLTDYQIEQILSFQQVYYYGQNCKNKKWNKNDIPKINMNQQYIFQKGDHVMYRFQLVDVLGEGSFGEVFKSIDHKHSNLYLISEDNQLIALKIVKYNAKYNEQAKSQISILNLIKRQDPSSTKNCIQINDCFVWRDRVCMTFDLLSLNLYELVKSNGYYGLPLDLIRRFVLQILNGIHFLHKQKIIHADLKPENILLKEANKSGLKIIDFGSSCMQNKTVYTYIQSRYYRAPEVILGMGYDRKIDIWSFGCVVAELHLGYPLFAGDDQHQQMCLLVEVLGLPTYLIKNTSKRWNIFFDEKDKLKQHPKKAEPASKSLLEALQNTQDKGFLKFIERCLQWNPKKRAQALQLLKDEWILKGLPQQFKNQHMKFISDQQQEMQMSSHVLKYKKTKSKSFCIRENQTKMTIK